MGPTQGQDVALTSQSLFLAKNRALFRRSSAGLLEPVTGFPEERGPSSLAVLDDTLLATVQSSCSGNGFCKANRVLESDDDGASWSDVADGFPSEVTGALTLFASPERLIATDYAGATASYEPGDATWTLVHADAPPNTPGDHLVVHVIGLDAGAIVASDIYNGGVVELPLGATQWQRVEGLGEWGYTGFVTRGATKITANGGGIFATVDGAWSKTLELENGGLTFVDLGDRFVAADAFGKLFSSKDGVTWSLEQEHTTSYLQAPQLAMNAKEVVWLGPGLLVSQNNGDSWSEVVAATEDVTEVHAQEGGVYAQESYNWRFGTDDAWSAAPWGESVPRLSFHANGVHICDESELYCSFYASGASVPKWTTNLDLAGESLRGIFGTSQDLFAITFESWSFACNAADRAGLSRFDTVSGTLEPSWDGLPYTDVSTCRLYWLVTEVNEAGGVLFASVQDDFDTLAEETYRSTDRGKTWTLVGDEAFVTVVEDARGIVALTRAGTLLRSADQGASFSSIQSPPGEEAITRLVTLAGSLVVSRKSKTEAELWTTRTDAKWTRIQIDSTPSVGPVQDMDVHDGKLWLATSTSGVWAMSAGCLSGG